MKIYVLSCDLLDGIEKDFSELTDAEVVELSEKDPLLCDIYEGIDHFCRAWNNADMFSPDYSYMRIINDKNLILWTEEKKDL